MRDVREYRLRFEGAELGDLEIVTCVPQALAEKEKGNSSDVNRA